MKHSDSLFALIKGLTKNEKGYFKRHALTHGKDESIYLRLFDSIEHQKEYDEKTLKKKFKGETFLKQFSVSKNHLYHNILKCMELYRQNNSMDGQVRSLLNRADFLFEKAMYKECENILEKANTLAKKYGMHYFLLEGLRVRRMIATRKFDFKKRKEIGAEEANTLDRMKNEKQIQNIYDKITPYYYLSTKGKSEINAVRRLVHNPRLRSESYAQSFIAKRIRLDCFIYYHVLTGNSDKTYEYAVKMGKLYLSDPPMIRYNINGYLNALNTIIYSCSALRKFDEMKYWIGQLLDSKKYIFNRANASFLFWLNFHVLHYNHLTGDFDSAVRYCREYILKHLDIYKNDLSPRALFLLYINISVSYFGTGNYSLSLTWLNKINNEVKIVTDPDALCFERLFYLIVHFELKHYDLMPYLIKSTYRFLSKMERLQPFQKAWIDFLKQLLKKEFSQKQLNVLFIQFKRQLEHMHKQTLDAQEIQFFDYTSWLESKIENRPFADVIKKKLIGIKA